MVYICMHTFKTLGISALFCERKSDKWKSYSYS